ncbi:family 16 glycosylhydrolase [Roseicyclus sp.]|uniref:family 16 glycosylhydrolase n=1 Tax=Roseicyclus sp. TaxID=1914329 RepID=UPI003FA00670
MPFTRRPALAALLALSAAPAAGQGFFDGFDDLDRARWPERWFVSDGWSNGDWMNCAWSREAVSVRNGHLVLGIHAAPDGTIRCGEIQSRAELGHGTYEIAMRTGAGSGLNAAFFTYIGPVHGRTHHEIDVEILLRDTVRATFNTYVEGTPMHGGDAPLSAPSDAGFHRYAFTWDADGIVWFLDGEEVHRTPPGASLPEPPQKIYASLWSSDSFPDWMGPFDPTALPAETLIDWIAFTPLGAPCHFPQSILCEGG